MKPPDHYLVVTDFDDAVKRVLDLLRDSDGKAFFFRGWKGLGASALLRATAKLLKSTRSDSDTKKHFGKIIHVDCSLWKNTRTMQRAIAKELNLGHLMPEFDKQDEEDDLKGVDDSSRAEIKSIGSEIYNSLRNENFLMIFHYGGYEDIDLAKCGIPEFGMYATRKLLWTNSGRFQLSQKEEIKLTSISATIDIQAEVTHDMTFTTPNMFTALNMFTEMRKFISQLARHLLHEEAAEVIGYMKEVIGYTGMDDINPATVADSFLYSLFLTEQVRGNSIGVDYDWATHACNYWICDGILQGDRAWEVGNALYGLIPQFGYSSHETEYVASYFDKQIRPYEGWNSVISNKRGAHDISDNASSYFLTFEGDSQLELENDLFHLASNLRVLKLCNCSFDFSSPPFLCCQNLRFLWLDHCTNTGKEQVGGPCFPNLLVLDLRSTDYVFMIELMTNLRELNTKGVPWRAISHAWTKLQNLHKLRVTESSDVITGNNWALLDMINLELLDLSGNTYMKLLPAMSSARSLKMLVLDGCSSLEHVALEGAPLLEIFSFDGYGPSENWTHSIQLPEKELRPKSRAVPTEAEVTKISLKGCARLHSIFLRALHNLKELDLSGTAIKTLDLSAMDVPLLKRLFLLGCEQFRCLSWDGTSPKLEVLHVDAQPKTSSVVCCGEQSIFGFEACLTFTDGRFMKAIQGLFGRLSGVSRSKVHLHISSMIHCQVIITKSIEEIGPNQEDLVATMGLLLPYNDIFLAKDDVTCPSLVWDNRQLQPLDKHIEIGERSHNVESIQGHFDNFGLSWLLPHVNSLHVHDNSSITAIPPSSPEWRWLEWCHVERCPKLHTLFTGWSRTSRRGTFYRLRTFSATNLLMAYCIWGKGTSDQSGDKFYKFSSLQHIYLHNCPRLVFVLPISFTLPELETLQIAYCGNLRHVFPLDDYDPEEIASGVTFKNLKHIKLHHLHKLEQICEATLTAPAMETISLRDCWRLRRLPAVARQGPKPVVDCEKDWWDKLEWDGLEAGHDPSLFQTRHSAYYKKTIPRGSLLR